MRVVVKTHGLKTRISDYKINNIVMCDEDINKKYVNDEDGFVFSVSFDVKPFFGRVFDYWYTGNGTDKDGWCVDKTLYYLLKVENDVYHLERIGSMC